MWRIALSCTCMALACQPALWPMLGFLRLRPRAISSVSSPPLQNITRELAKLYRDLPSDQGQAIAHDIVEEVQAQEANTMDREALRTIIRDVLGAEESVGDLRDLIDAVKTTCHQENKGNT